MAPNTGLRYTVTYYTDSTGKEFKTEYPPAPARDPNVDHLADVYPGSGCYGNGKHEIGFPTRPQVVYDCGSP